jgi:hypothetical protein
MFCRDQLKFGKQLRRILCKFSRDRHRKHADCDRLIRIVEQVVTRIEESSVITLRNINKLKQPRDISSNGCVRVVPLKLFDQDVEIRFDEFRMTFDAIADRPRGTLRNSIDRTKQMLDQFPETLLVLSDIIRDLHGLRLGMNFKKGFADVHQKS